MRSVAHCLQSCRGWLLLVLLPAVLAAQPRPPVSLAQTLRASRWQQRVLLVVASSAADPVFQTQAALLAAAAPALAARDVRIVNLLADELPAADRQLLARQFQLRPARFAVLLLGKDGGEKLRRVRPVTIAELSETIDQMPMRREEMRRAGPK